MSRSKSLPGKRGVGQNPWEKKRSRSKSLGEKEESLEIPGWKKRSHSKSLLGISHIIEVARAR